MSDYQITNYRGRDGDIGNGDPIIVYSPETQAITLGTGFYSMEDVRAEIERVVDEPEGKSFDVFGVDANIAFDQ